MKTLFLFLLLLLFSISANEKSFRATVISENGLKMRETPEPTGKEIMTVPFLEEVTLASIRWNDTKVEKQNYSPKNQKTEKGEHLFKTSPKIGRKYGNWQKISWKGKSGWVFNAWLLYRKEPYITNLHYLNELPQQFFVLSDKRYKNKSTIDTIYHNQNWGKIHKLVFDLLPYTSESGIPTVVYQFDETSAAQYTIISVETLEKGYLLTVRENSHGQKPFSFSIVAEGNYYQLKKFPISAGRLLPIVHFSGTISDTLKAH